MFGILFLIWSRVSDHQQLKIGNILFLLLDIIVWVPKVVFKFANFAVFVFFFVYIVDDRNAFCECSVHFYHFQRF